MQSVENPRPLPSRLETNYAEKHKTIFNSTSYFGLYFGLCLLETYYGGRLMIKSKYKWKHDNLGVAWLPKLDLMVRHWWLEWLLDRDWLRGMFCHFRGFGKRALTDEMLEAIRRDLAGITSRYKYHADRNDFKGSMGWEKWLYQDRIVKIAKADPWGFYRAYEASGFLISLGRKEWGIWLWISDTPGNILVSKTIKLPARDIDYYIPDEKMDDDNLHDGCQSLMMFITMKDTYKDTTHRGLKKLANLIVLGEDD